MYCQNCGTKNSDDAVFCESCGTKLERNDLPVEQTPEMIQPKAVQPKAVPAADTAAVRQPVQKWLVVLILEAVALIAALYAALALAKKGFGAEHMAGNFFVEMANGDWEQAYGKLDVDESEFINAKMFALANQQTSFGLINAYTVEKQGGAFGDLVAKSTGLGTTVDVRYRTRGSNSDSSYEVVLNKQSGKKMLLFDDWKVSTDQLIGTDYRLHVPEGATVVFDGITLSDSYRDSGADDDYGICYVIPQLFLGSHTFTVSKENYDEVTRTVQIRSSNDGCSVLDLAMKKEVLEDLIQLAGKNMQTIYTAAVEGKKFAAIEDLFAKDAREDAEYAYSNLLSNLSGNGSSIPYKLSFKNIQGSAYSNGTSVSLSAEYHIEYSYEDWWDGSINTDSMDSSEQFTFDFIEEDGNWVQTNLGCYTLYY